MKCLLYIDKKCKSCNYLNLSYEETLKIKENDFFKYFSFSEVNYQGIVGVSDAEASRNKAKLSVVEENGEIFFGIYSSDQKFTSLENCPLHFIEINNLLPTLKEKIVKFKIIPYNLESKKGELKNVIITRSDTSGEMMLRFVVRSKESIDRLRKISNELSSELKSLKLISANMQPNHSAVLEGDEEIIFTENKTIIHNYNSVKMHLGVKSFFQVTSEIARKLYSEVQSFLKDKNLNSMLDLYCGVGAFSFYSSLAVKNIYGVEISDEAINCANLTKVDNQIENVSFKSLDVNKFWNEISGKYDVILVNPPRKGVGEFSMSKIKNLSPKYLIYSSCNIETLHTDFAHIQSEYKIIFSKIFDMFPFSKHFEVLMIFEKKD